MKCIRFQFHTDKGIVTKTVVASDFTKACEAVKKIEPKFTQDKIHSTNVIAENIDVVGE